LKILVNDQWFKKWKYYKHYIVVAMKGDDGGWWGIEMKVSEWKSFRQPNRRGELKTLLIFKTTRLYMTIIMLKFVLHVSLTLFGPFFTIGHTWPRRTHVFCKLKAWKLYYYFPHFHASFGVLSIIMLTKIKHLTWI